MHTFLNDFHQYRKYSAQKASHQAELRREEKFIDQKYLFISSLQTDYINLDRRLSFGRKSERANTVQKKCTFCGGTNASLEKCFKRIRQEKEILVWLMLQTIDEWNGYLENVLDVDQKIT